MTSNRTASSNVPSVEVSSKKTVTPDSEARDTPTPDTCYYCPTPAVGYTSPALCEKHLDLVVIIEFMVSRNQPVTVAIVQERLAIARQSGAHLALTADDVPAFMTTTYPQQYQMLTDP